MEFSQYKYRHGHWVWDDLTNGLAFLSDKEPESATPTPANVPTIGPVAPLVKRKSIACSHEKLLIKFRDSVDALDQVRFRRHFRRKVGPNEPDVVTIQDLRDVVLFCIPPQQLTTELILFFHTPSMDFLLRSLIIYFQFFIQVWDTLMTRREEAKTKLYQPDSVLIEKKLKEDLADLRSMVSRAYLLFLIGADDTKKFHHIHSKSGSSYAERDVRFYEFLYQVCTKVVWIALLKRNENLIEMEMNKMFRSDSYNPIAHLSRHDYSISHYPHENQILYGDANIDEMKLLQRSLIGKEMYLAQHDFKMLAIGNVEFENANERIKYLEIAYAAPEELLPKLQVPVGILGYPRSDFDPMLSLKFAKNDDGSIKVWPKIILPPKEEISLKDFEYPTKPSKYAIIKSKSAKIQCKVWLNFKKNTRRATLLSKLSNRS